MDDWSKSIARMGERQEQERIAFNERLGEPSLFVPDAEDARFGIGYWRVEGGVIAYRKYANGYDPLSRHVYEDSFIELLYGLRALPKKGG